MTDLSFPETGTRTPPSPQAWPLPRPSDKPWRPCEACCIANGHPERRRGVSTREGRDGAMFAADLTGRGFVGRFLGLSRSKAETATGNAQALCCRAFSPSDRAEGPIARSTGLQPCVRRCRKTRPERSPARFDQVHDDHRLVGGVGRPSSSFKRYKNRCVNATRVELKVVGRSLLVPSAECRVI